MKFGSLFSGIGGFDLGLERAGMECIWQVEIDDYCTKVLEKHWSNVKRYRDVRDCGRHNLEPVDLVCGGFPCQPHSVAGQRRGAADDRNLWPEMRRIIDELRPRWIVAENVPGIKGTILDDVLDDLESLSYETGAVDIPALALGAPHIRQRVFIVAYAGGQRCSTEIQHVNIGWEQAPAESSSNGKVSALAHVNCEWEQQSEEIGPEVRGWTGNCSEVFGKLREHWAIEPRVGRVADGVPRRMERLRALGNAVVPQVAEFIGRNILRVL